MGILRAAWDHFDRRVLKDERGFLQFLAPFVPALKAALPFVGGALASQFSGGGSGGGSSAGSVNTQTLMPEWQQGLGQDLSSWASKYLQLFNPGAAYPGKLSASTTPTGIESMGLSELQKLLGGSATGDLFGAAKGQVMDTLSGKYSDPSTSPFLQAFTKLAGQNLRDSINTERGQRGARGTYFTRAGVDAESKLGERTQNYLNTLIEDFINQERGRQQTAVGQAQSLEGYATDASLKRVTASQALGGLERTLEQADLERSYNAWLKQRSELGTVPGVAQSAFGTNIPTLTTLTQPAQQTSGQDVAPWISMLMQLMPSLSGA